MIKFKVKIKSILTTYVLLLFQQYVSLSSAVQQQYGQYITPGLTSTEQYLLEGLEETRRQHCNGACVYLTEWSVGKTVPWRGVGNVDEYFWINDDHFFCDPHSTHASNTQCFAQLEIKDSHERNLYLQRYEGYRERFLGDSDRMVAVGRIFVLQVNAPTQFGINNMGINCGTAWVKGNTHDILLDGAFWDPEHFDAMLVYKFQDDRGNLDIRKASCSIVETRAHCGVLDKTPYHAPDHETSTVQLALEFISKSAQGHSESQDLPIALTYAPIPEVGTKTEYT